MNCSVCGARRRSGGTCRKPAGWGTNHNGYGTCKLHAGATPAATAFARDLAAPDRARRAMEILGLENWKPLSEEDVTAMEAAIWSAGRAVCGARVRQTKQPCRRPAGWGTSHVGFGNCKLHGGATRNGVKHAYALAAQLEMFRLVARGTRAQESSPTAELLLHKRWSDIAGRTKTQGEEE